MKLRDLKHLSTRSRSSRSEKRLAKLLGGKVQPASGALPVGALKGDVVTAEFMFDDKITGAASFAVSVKLWRKTANDAARQGRRPVIRISFTEGPNLYIVDEPTFAKLLECPSQSDDRPTKFPMGKSRR